MQSGEAAGLAIHGEVRRIRPESPFSTAEEHHYADMAKAYLGGFCQITAATKKD